jgi:hypothetical protein
MDAHCLICASWRCVCVRRQALAADVDGELSLVLSTMAGAITALGTRLPAHPLNLWEAPARGG